MPPASFPKCGGRLFTDRLCNSVTATDASGLQAVGNAGAQLGGIPACPCISLRPGRLIIFISNVFFIVCISNKG